MQWPAARPRHQNMPLSPLDHPPQVSPATAARHPTSSFCPCTTLCCTTTASRQLRKWMGETYSWAQRAPPLPDYRSHASRPEQDLLCRSRCSIWALSTSVGTITSTKHDFNEQPAWRRPGATFLRRRSTTHDLTPAYLRCRSQRLQTCTHLFNFNSSITFFSVFILLLSLHITSFKISFYILRRRFILQIL